MRVFLPYPPSGNRRLTARKDGKGFVNTAKYRSWKDEAAWTVAMAVRGERNKIRGAFELHAIAMPPALNRTRDIDNLLKATCDALKAGGLIEDDSFCQRINIEWGMLDSPGILVGVQPCQRLSSSRDGSDRSPSDSEPNRARPSPRQRRLVATIQDAVIGELLATGKGVMKASANPLSSMSVGDIASRISTKRRPVPTCPECQGKGFVWMLKRKAFPSWAEMQKLQDEPPKLEPVEKERWLCPECRGAGNLRLPEDEEEA
jgi:crossover junction endodeoxyribonuclease RusA